MECIVRSNDTKLNIISDKDLSIHVEFKENNNISEMIIPLSINKSYKINYQVYCQMYTDIFQFDKISVSSDNNDKLYELHIIYNKNIGELYVYFTRNDTMLCHTFRSKSGKFSISRSIVAINNWSRYDDEYSIFITAIPIDYDEHLEVVKHNNHIYLLDDGIILDPYYFSPVCTCTEDFKKL